MRWNWVSVIGFILALSNQATADVDSYYVYSLDWLTDASQSVQLATVVREQGTTRIKSVDRVLKGAVDMAVPAAEDLSAAVTAGGENRVLLFLRPVPKKRTPEVLYVVYLNNHLAPADPVARAAAYRAALPEGFDRPSPTDSTKCIAIDRTGRVLVDPEAVVKLVEKRAQQHPKRITDAGFYAPRGDELEDQNTDYNVFVPYDPDERGEFLKKVRNSAGVDRAKAATHLAHYPDAEVIAALKKCLTDDYHNNQTVLDNPGNTPRGAEIYIVRRAAYQSLRQLKVEVPKPELEHRR
jgi:hypothetical protein